jgi:hypothetical protein
MLLSFKASAMVEIFDWKEEGKHLILITTHWWMIRSITGFEFHAG